MGVSGSCNSRFSPAVSIAPRWSSTVERHQGGQVERLLAQQDLAARDARHVEQVVDQPGHVPDLAVHHVACRRGDRGTDARHLQDVQRIANGCQRIAQLVSEHGQELVLAAIVLLDVAIESRIVDRDGRPRGQVVHQRQVAVLIVPAGATQGQSQSTRVRPRQQRQDGGGVQVPRRLRPAARGRVGNGQVLQQRRLAGRQHAIDRVPQFIVRGLVQRSRQVCTAESGGNTQASVVFQVTSPSSTRLTAARSARDGTTTPSRSRTVAAKSREVASTLLARARKSERRVASSAAARAACSRPGPRAVRPGVSPAESCGTGRRRP